MEAVWTNRFMNDAIIDFLKKLTKKDGITLSVWQWIGHLVPLTSLFVVILLHFFAPQAWQDWALISIATGFAMTTFVFWWWVVYSVKLVYGQFNALKLEVTRVSLLLIDTQSAINTRAEDIEEIHSFGERTEQAASKPFGDPDL